MRKFISILANGALDLFSPPYCLLCGKPTHRRRRALCWECLRAPLLRANDALACEICGGRAIAAGRPCPDCESERPAFYQARSAAVFAGDIRLLVHMFKYRRALWLRGDFCDWLHGCFITHYANAVFDCIVPVPVSRVKFFQRSYNQAEFLAAGLGKLVSLPVFPNALARRGGAATQTTLTRQARLKNAARAFLVAQPKKVAGKDVLLVDDVMTSGATANACARALLRAGAQSVRVITVARGVLDGGEGVRLSKS